MRKRMRIHAQKSLPRWMQNEYSNFLEFTHYFCFTLVELKTWTIHIWYTYIYMSILGEKNYKARSFVPYHIWLYLVTTTWSMWMWNKLVWCKMKRICTLGNSGEHVIKTPRDKNCYCKSVLSSELCKREDNHILYCYTLILHKNQVISSIFSYLGKFFFVTTV